MRDKRTQIAKSFWENPWELSDAEILYKVEWENEYSQHYRLHKARGIEQQTFENQACIP